MAEWRNSEGYPDLTAYQAIRKIEREERKYRPVVYICSPHTGNTEKNLADAGRYSRFAYESGVIPVAPGLMFSQFLDHENPQEKDDAQFMSRVLIRKCREMWAFGDRVSGFMKREISAAQKYGIRIRRFNEDCMEI